MLEVFWERLLRALVKNLQIKSLSMILLQKYILGNACGIVHHIPLLEGTIDKKNIHEKTEASSEGIRVTPTDVNFFFFC